ncbi:MAG: tRNA (5-methylaminomethyl-2-thiouridine)(34)-methyltransferase MnmD [Polaribacter sp.]|nr:tRNA (5-methylaminomethyl-2-thiouridine)(34)-methyltransferase MnmD [Polaribacter sp.]
MKREILRTADGSTTIHLIDWDEHYHSKHGAIQEAYHVFIKNGLEAVSLDEISILEIGFGTGLNAFITFLEAQKTSKFIDYVGLEAYPVETSEIQQLNYVSELKAQEFQSIFDEIHHASWEEKSQISTNFSLTKRQQFFQDIDDENVFNLIYFDAFGVRVQPELWTEEVFLKMYKALKKNGILVTYAAAGSVRRALQSAGFKVERLQGPPGKREMLRGVK